MPATASRRSSPVTFANSVASASLERLGPTVAALTLLLMGFAANARAQTATEVESLRQTVTTVREVGVAMFRWSEDNAGGIAEMAESTRVDLASIETISADELAELIVPRYIDELPRTDSWSRNLEFRMTRSETGPAQLAVRSGGLDGQLESTDYVIGPFSSADAGEGHDIVWINGYFVRWPKADG